MEDLDRQLWQHFAATVRPLSGRGRRTEPRTVRRSVSPAKADLPVSPPLRSLSPITVGEPPPGLDRATWLRLRRGRAAPERRLDLHGFRSEAASVAVEAFVAECSAAGLRVVEVVTGRGRGAQGGVIRRALPDWLNRPMLRPLLLAVCHPPGDNTGAVLLLLRRRR